ncbi:MAG: fasciclin domain-containing protein [Ginsengibacter sp.]
MKKILINTAFFLLLAAAMTSCTKDYITGGKIEDVNMYKDKTNFEVLSQDPLFDTLVQIIEASGLKDKINQAGSTFFAPTDYSILTYMQLRTVYVQENYDQNGKFGLDSLNYYLKTNKNNTRDSLLMYMIPKPLPYDALTRTGIAYQSGLAGNMVVVSYEPVGRNNVVSTTPRQVVFTQLWFPYIVNDANPAEEIPEKIGVRTSCITSGINTKSGIMNYLNNFHTLFFYGTKK